MAMVCASAAVRTPVSLPQLHHLKFGSSAFFNDPASRGAFKIQSSTRKTVYTMSRGSLVIKCEQATEEAKNGLDIWIGRAAMIGFVAALTVEISTGKGVLENAGLTTPLPTVALGVTALVGAFTAFKVFQSSPSKD